MLLRARRTRVVHHDVIEEPEVQPAAVQGLVVGREVRVVVEVGGRGVGWVEAELEGDVGGKRVDGGRAARRARRRRRRSEITVEILGKLLLRLARASLESHCEESREGDEGTSHRCRRVSHLEFVCGYWACTSLARVWPAGCGIFVAAD